MSQSLSQYRLERRFQARIYIFAGFIFLTAVVLIVQLANLQLVHGDENRVLARKFVSRQEFTRAPRGLVYDRNWPNNNDSADSVLVKNINYIDFVIHPARFKDLKRGREYIHRFSVIMGRNPADYREFLQPRAWRKLVRKNKYITLITRMTRREQERLAAFSVLSRRGQFITNHLRYYTMGPALAHVTGYVGLPSRRELKAKKALSYQFIGKGGMEAVYDNQLRGTDGVSIRHRVLDYQETMSTSEHGNNLVLTIDRRMQAAAYNALVKSKKRGAVVAIKAATGEVLAMASNPAFDPNILSSGTSKQRTSHFYYVKEHEGFLNLGIQARFPPASSFKPIVALAALESTGRFAANENTAFRCRGKWTLASTLKSVPDSHYFCHEHAGHGMNNMVMGLATSCNVYFYQLGYNIGPTRIIHYARAFGLDKKTGIDLPGEIAGHVPDQRWKQVRLSSRWYDGDTVNLSIGQGFLQITPIENAVMYAALINGGRVFRPYLLKEIRNPVSNRLLRRNVPQLVSEIPVARGTLDVIDRGLRAVVTRGTVRHLNKRNRLPIAGKTGTAQTRSRRNGRNHAWFVGYAPHGASPEDLIVVAVFVEYGQGGSARAAPIAAEVLYAAFPDWKPGGKVPGTKVPENKTPENKTPPTSANAPGDTVTGNLPGTGRPDAN